MLSPTSSTGSTDTEPIGVGLREGLWRDCGDAICLGALAVGPGSACQPATGAPGTPGWGAFGVYSSLLLLLLLMMNLGMT